MCGIFGFVGAADGSLDLSQALAATMELAHRGPDEWGLAARVPAAARGGWPEAPHVDVRMTNDPDLVVLGHRRLRVIDLSPAARQPMLLPSGDLVSFNGEVYNFRELRTELEADGARFSSASDTEVILHAHARWGREAVARFDGMFAYAHWNAAGRELTLARDRVGKKPLFYRLSGGRLVFASEIKALLRLPGWTPEIDPEALDDYLTYGYVPGNRTIFRGVRKVPPGHALTWRGREATVSAYWKVPEAAPADHADDAAAIRDVRARLEHAVRARLLSDVPVGAFLSGGVDSSAIVALMARAVGDGVKTFSIGFPESSFDELPYARAVARQFHTDHHEFVVKPDAAAELPKLVWHLDEPFADASALPTYLLARLAREHVTVVLTGDGGDEAFAGYDSYKAERWLGHYLSLPAGVRRTFEALLADRAESADRTALVRRAKRFTEKAHLEEGRREWRVFLSPAQKRSLYAPGFAQGLGTHDALDQRTAAFARWASLTSPDRLQLWDLTVYLPDDLLVKSDRATMAHGLEARCPLLDHRLLEAALALPWSLRIRGRETKYVLKRALADLLPRAILQRPKQGFGVPVAHWFRGELREMARDLLNGPTFRGRGYFDPVAVERLIEAHESGRADHGHRLWALVVLELWMRRFLDSRNDLPSTAVA